MTQAHIAMGLGGTILESPMGETAESTSHLLLSRRVNHLAVHAGSSPRLLAHWISAIQHMARRTPHGIPLSLTIDARTIDSDGPPEPHRSPLTDLGFPQVAALVVAGHAHDSTAGTLDDIIRLEQQSAGVNVVNVPRPRRGDHSNSAMRVRGIVHALADGADQFMGSDTLYALEEALTSGHVSESRIDESVRRILCVKFALGLFDQQVSTDEHPL
ncbi:MAG: hypothetical protein LBH13_00335 [Cellulomonadaceae bacterium]|nr:hypothetical protein [Cellulomonadaceae bacterium]